MMSNMPGRRRSRQKKFRNKKNVANFLSALLLSGEGIKLINVLIYRRKKYILLGPRKEQDDYNMGASDIAVFLSTLLLPAAEGFKILNFFLK